MLVIGTYTLPALPSGPSFTIHPPINYPQPSNVFVPGPGTYSAEHPHKAMGMGSPSWTMGTPIGPPEPPIPRMLRPSSSMGTLSPFSPRSGHTNYLASSSSPINPLQRWSSPSPTHGGGSGASAAVREAATADLLPIFEDGDKLFQEELVPFDASATTSTKSTAPAPATRITASVTATSASITMNGNSYIRSGAPTTTITTTAATVTATASVSVPTSSESFEI
jgi:hypothetical protein